MNDFFIQKELNEHIKNTLVRSSFYSNPDLSLIFSMVFLQSYGFLEQKMACITWEMAHRQYYERYDFVKKRFEGMSWGALEKTILKLKNLKEDENKLELASILDINCSLIDEFQNIFSSIYNDELAYPFYILKNKVKELGKTESLKEKKLKELTKKMSRTRNYLAHFKSFFVLENTVSLISEDGWDDDSSSVDCFSKMLLYIVMLIQFDRVLTDAYKKWDLRNY